MINERAYWNNDAKNYEARVDKSHKAYEKIIDYIKKEINKDMLLLDIGTGTGEIPINISNNVKNIEAIDYSFEMIKIAKQKAKIKGIKNISFSVQDSNNLIYKDNTFDVITIINLLHIIPKPEKVIEEAKRLIKNYGKIIIASYLHNENIKSRLISCIMKRKGHPIFTKYNSNTIFSFIENCSLNITFKEKLSNIMPILYLIALRQY